MTIKATYVDHMGTDLSVVNAARVSFGKESEWGVSFDCPEFCGRNVLSERDTKLVNYLASHGHVSPFGHCFASFHVKAPIFVARQLVKHKFLRWNEISRRYVDDDPEFYTPETWRGVAKDKKQGSAGVIKQARLVTDAVEDGYRKQLNTYKRLLEEGVAPEMARIILPQALLSEWYWSGSLDSFANMCNLRCKEDTQYETRLVGGQIDEIMAGLYPVSWKALRGETT